MDGRILMEMELFLRTLFDGNYDAGHITAHSLGGRTKPDNMVIEKMPKNRGKGDKETVVTR